MLTANLMVKKFLERFTKKNCKKLIKKEFRDGKIMKRKGDKVYIKLKGYGNSCDNWID